MAGLEDELPSEAALHGVIGAHLEIPAKSSFFRVVHESRLRAEQLSRLADAVTSISHPTQIGPYRVLEVIGEGGMGTVYKAQQSAPMERVVAIKVIKLRMDTRSVIARFEAEQHPLALMNHPNVARVFDAGVTDAVRPYFVMEFVAGESITRFADRNQLTVHRRLELFIQACDAVEHAHQKGVIHRDLKPANILVSLDGEGRARVKVIDFGVAKAVDQRLTPTSFFTDVGQFMGTLEYMSPEQADAAGNVDTRTDICSLGVILCELLVGTVAFDTVTLPSSDADSTGPTERRVWCLGAADAGGDGRHSRPAARPGPSRRRHGDDPPDHRRIEPPSRS